ncbi:MAG: MFS transporter [Anaerolineae bacterium]
MRTSSVGAARVAVLVIFFVNAIGMANWIARIPLVKEKLGLSEGQLGLVLLGISMGVLTALPLAGGLIARFSSRTVTTGAGLLNCLALPFLGLAPSPITLWAALYFFGMTLSTMDVAMNAQAIEVERRHGKSIMSSFHAAFSIGGFFGAGISGLFVAVGVSIVPHFVFVSVVFAGALLVASRYLVDVEGERTGKGERVFVLPGRALLPLGAVAFCAAIAEGTMADWSAVYLREVVGTNAGIAAAGFAGFSLTMTAGRLAGDWLIRRFDRVMLVRAGGLTAGLGFGLAVMVPEFVPVVIGFALVGAGASFIIPLVFSTAGNLPNVPSGVGIAGVATLGYSGFLAGPPLIGLVAEATSLRVSMALVGLLIASLIISAVAVRKPAEVIASVESPKVA